MRAWFEEALFYHIYPLGFCGAPKRNDFVSEPRECLNKVYEWIEHIKYLGLNAIYFGPVFESGSHGYDTVDYFTIDRRLGRNDTFKKLVEALHTNGIKVVVDTVFNHAGRDFPAFKDVMINGKNSGYCDWFQNIDFNRKSPLGDKFDYDTWRGFYELVKLDLKNSAVRVHSFEAVNMWINEFDIDGLRLDCADCLDGDFVNELVSLCKGIKSDFFIIGEICNENLWPEKSMLDSVTNYVGYKGLYSSLNDKNYYEIAHTLSRQFNEKTGLYKNKYLYNFADNHDVNRITSTLRHSPHLYPLHVLLFTMPGIPSIYYGSEWGIEGRNNLSDDYLRPELDLTNIASASPNRDLAIAISKLSCIRKSSNALMHGSYVKLLVKHEQFAFARLSREECVIVILNSSDKAENIEIELPVYGNKAVDVLNNNESFYIYNKSLKLNLYPCWGRILKIS